MYAGLTLRTKSGLIMGVHQRIDRVAYRHLKKMIPESLNFPAIKGILHFEGLNGPDGIKRKSPAKDEPWHYIDPTNPDDRAVVDMILDHIHNMSTALAAGNTQRSAFEAAWMAHAIVDGLTPAHHFPLEAKLRELRGGQGLETRITAKDKIVLPGDTRRHQIKNNWEYWGTGGIMTSHLVFEHGVSTSMTGATFEIAQPTAAEFERVRGEGYEAIFWDTLKGVHALGMYDEFVRTGWNRHLATQTRKELLPRIMKAVTLAWYQAIVDAERA